MALFWHFMREIVHRLPIRDRLLNGSESFDAGGFRCDRWDSQCRLSKEAQTKIPALFPSAAPLLDISLLCSFRSSRDSALNPFSCLHSLILPPSFYFGDVAANLASFLASAWHSSALEL